MGTIHRPWIIDPSLDPGVPWTIHPCTSVKNVGQHERANDLLSTVRSVRSVNGENGARGWAGPLAPPKYGPAHM
jgi:hypothetical protein